MTVVYLKPRSSYRTELRSDTLFGLICWGIRQIFSEADLVRLLEGFAGRNPPFLITSAFPYRDSEKERVHFLPRPLLRPARLDAKAPEEATRQKQFRRHQRVPSPVFQQFLDGRLDEERYYASDIWEYREGVPQHREDVLRNTIDRLSGTTGGSGGNLFQTTEIFTKEGGLYFLIKGEERALIEGALGFLSHLGMGGDSSLGKGVFEVTMEDINLFQEPEGARHFITLSLYYPTLLELEAYRNETAWYDLTMRKGKVGGHFLHVGDFWKRTVPMFTEGSTFPKVRDARYYGQNLIVKRKEDGLPFDVQQFGYAFDVGIRMEEG